MPVTLKLKSIILSFFLFACSLQNAIAQEEEMFEYHTFYGGVITGLNLCQVDGDNFAGFTKKGMNAGAVVYVKLYKKAIGSMEILFSQKGSTSAKGEMLASGVYVKKYGIDLNYAEIPVMINFFDKHKSHVGVGVSYSQLTSSNEYIATSPTITYDPQQHPFNKSDVQLLVGGNLHITKGLFLNLRYQYSILPIRDKVEDVSRGQLYNNVWTIRLMYLFM